MKYMATYDLMESMRNTNEWMGATARAMASYPAFALSMNPMLQITAAWGQVAERSFARMVAKPDWGIRSIPGPDGQDHLVDVTPVVSRPFGDLVQFSVRRRAPMARRILLVAPMSGHYATLLRSTVASLLPDADVFVTDWHNARDIPVSLGKFDIEDYTLYLVEFMRHLGPDSHVIAVCQPAPLTLAATAYLAAEDPNAQPKSLTLIGGPVDPDAAATDVTDFGRRITMGQLEQIAIQRVGFKYKGVGRLVYPGLMQLQSFISMNAERHSKAFSEQIMRVARGEASDHDAHNRFYDEYLSVMDMTAEFYLSTVERIFKNREIARNQFMVAGKKVDIAAITQVSVMTVEGAEDDISAPGQCVAALAMLTGLADSKKTQHLEPGAGHYGIFAGRSWRLNIRPLVLSFIDASTGSTPAQEPARRMRLATATPVAAAPAASAPTPSSKPKPATTAAKSPTARLARAATKSAPAVKPATPKPPAASAAAPVVRAEVPAAPVAKPAPPAAVEKAPIVSLVPPAPKPVPPTVAPPAASAVPPAASATPPATAEKPPVAGPAPAAATPVAGGTAPAVSLVPPAPKAAPPTVAAPAASAVPPAASATPPATAEKPPVAGPAPAAAAPVAGGTAPAVNLVPPTPPAAPPVADEKAKAPGETPPAASGAGPVR
jgi:poly(3-hydroxybutyrate) depolymerase